MRRTILNAPDRRNATNLVNAKATQAMLIAMIIKELRAMSRPPLMTSRFLKTVTDGTWREQEPTSNVASELFGVRLESRVTENNTPNEQDFKSAKFAVPSAMGVPWYTAVRIQ